MRRIALLCACLAAVAAMAEEPPDYSRQNLTRLFAQREIDLPPRPPGPVQWHFGYVQFRALGMDWRVFYLPIAAPLPGTRMNETAKLPDPFALTNTAVPGQRPFIVEPSAEVAREVRRVRRRTGL